MSYTALYRKFRPQEFEDVKGQEHIVTTLKNQIKADRIGHAYLFCGTRGTGKTTVAKIFAKAVNCEHPVDGSPCGKCPVCQGIAAGTSMNVIEIDAASNNGVDNIRQIREEVSYRPTEGKYKAYIIDEVHMLSAGAFNALLKTLEEPPAYVIFILATTEAHKIPITILSRCQRYDFHRISIDTITDRLAELMRTEQVDVEERALRYVAKAGDGSMRDALSLLDQCIAFHLGEKLTYENVLEVLGAVDTEVFSSLLRQVLAKDVTGAIRTVDHLVDQGRELGQMVNDFTWYMRNLLLIQSADDMEEVLDMSADHLAALKEEAQMVEPETLIRYIRIFSELSSQIRYAAQKRNLLEIAIIKLCRPQMENDLSALNERMDDIEQKLETEEIILPVSQRVIFCNYIDLADVNEEWLQCFRNRMRVFQERGMVHDMSQHYHLNLFRYQTRKALSEEKKKEVFEVLSQLWNMKYQYMRHSEFLIYAGGLKPNLMEQEQEKGVLRFLELLSIRDCNRVLNVGRFNRSLFVLGETEYYERHARKCEEELKKLDLWLRHAKDENLSDFASSLNSTVSEQARKLQERLQVFQRESGLYPMSTRDYIERRVLFRRSYVRPEGVPRRLQDEKKKEIVSFCNQIKNSEEKEEWKKNLTLQLHYPDLLKLSQEWREGRLQIMVKNSVNNYISEMQLAAEECEVFQKAVYSWIEEFAQENLITEKMREMREDREGKELQLKDEFNRASIFSDLRTCFSQIKEKTRFQVPAVIQAQEVEQIAMINSEIGRDWQTKGYDITEVRDEQIAVMNNLYPYEIVYMKFGKYIDLTNGEQTEQQLRMVFR